MKDWKPRSNDGPVSIPYATAASQFLYGTSAVEAALKASRRKLYKLYIYRGKGRGARALEKDRHLGDLARDQGIRVEYLEEASLPMLNKMSESRPHNGHVLEASPLPQLPIVALGEFSEDQDRPGFKLAVGHQSYEEAQVNGTSGFVSTESGSRKPLVLVVDQVVDPGNLGAILRTASFMGVTAVAVSKKGSAPVTPVVLKASAGAAEALTMLSVDSVEDFLRNSKDNGWKVYAACPPKPDSKRPQIDTIDLEKDDPLLKDPCILLVGSEGEGLPRALRRAADVEISIPNLSGSDVVDSLNVSVATGLLCSAFLRGMAKARGNTASDPGALF
ncbi:putative 23s rrna (guanosine-2) methyltransferase rlmb [Diaporthe ampelina]|uniref:rRNA methyltransferase 1, mitochondrial n=1 Tax=Diaporthe ampelina TaxID=1214573 RepID=A0A0G2FE53_9PEZI|nr:putative 23s rrna (guanosine-2) methyltransferase rlmb [Diaporthe ampelina]